ncbi:MAG: ATP-binding protein [Lentisphaeria bacterium]
MERRLVEILSKRFGEARRFLQVLVGPRQTGKTTAARQALAKLTCPSRFILADEPVLHDNLWLQQQWEISRLQAREKNGGILVIDEIQKVPNWPETIKRLWDEDSATGTPLHVLLLGSAQLLVQKGLTESLAGRFELTRASHWSLPEMTAAFGWDWQQFVFFGGYPGAASLVSEEDRWRRYVRDSLIETTLTRDILFMSQVNKPALLRRLFELGCAYSGQELSYTKLLGQLQDAGNTVTLAHYLDLFTAAGLLTGLPKYSADTARKRASTPKFQVFNNALVSALASYDYAVARQDPERWGRLTESAVGAHLLNGATENGWLLHYWRDRGDEVDFVLAGQGKVVAFEVKSGRRGTSTTGMKRFADRFKPNRLLLVGGDGIPLDEFLRTPPNTWL